MPRIKTPKIQLSLMLCPLLPPIYSCNHSYCLVWKNYLKIFLMVKQTTKQIKSRNEKKGQLSMPNSKSPICRTSFSQKQNQFPHFLSSLPPVLLQRSSTWSPSKPKASIPAENELKYTWNCKRLKPLLQECYLESEEQCCLYT